MSWKSRVVLGIALSGFLVLCVSGCGKGGNIDAVRTHAVPSKMYSEEDIDAAIGAVEEEFAESWSGCTLTEIYYAGDEVSRDHQDWAARNHADEVLVLLSSFDVDASGGNGSLNPNSTYDDWNWILVRTGGGPWQEVDHGY